LILNSEFGPWKTAINFFKECQNWIETSILNGTHGEFSCHIPNFADPNTFDFNEDIDSIYKSLKNVEEHDQEKANKLKLKVEAYVNDIMNPGLQELDIIIIMNAFLDKENEPFIDIFHVNDVGEKQRRLHDLEDFCDILSGPFVIWYYKVSTYCKY
jgi:hypothetical protein